MDGSTSQAGGKKPPQPPIPPPKQGPPPRPPRETPLPRYHDMSTLDGGWFDITPPERAPARPPTRREAVDPYNDPREDAKQRDSNFKAHLKAVQKASRRFQSVTCVHDPKPWPLPEPACEPDESLFNCYVEGLQETVRRCEWFEVNMYRESEKGENLDKTIDGLAKREINNPDTEHTPSAVKGSKNERKSSESFKTKTKGGKASKNKKSKKIAEVLRMSPAITETQTDTVKPAQRTPYPYTGMWLDRLPATDRSFRSSKFGDSPAGFISEINAEDTEVEAMNAATDAAGVPSTYPELVTSWNSLRVAKAHAFVKVATMGLAAFQAQVADAQALNGANLNPRVDADGREAAAGALAAADTKTPESQWDNVPDWRARFERDNQVDAAYAGVREAVGYSPVAGYGTDRVSVPGHRHLRHDPELAPCYYTGGGRMPSEEKEALDEERVIEARDKELGYNEQNGQPFEVRGEHGHSLTPMSTGPATLHGAFCETCFESILSCHTCRRGWPNMTESERDAATQRHHEMEDMTSPKSSANPEAGLCSGKESLDAQIVMAQSSDFVKGFPTPDRASQDAVGVIEIANSDPMEDLQKYNDNDKGEGKEKSPIDYDAEIKARKVRIQPLVPQVLDMPGSFTEAMCKGKSLKPRPLFSLTLIDINTLMTKPSKKREILLRHFEVGLDGVEAIIQCQAQVPETPAQKKVREDRLGPLGTLKRGNRGGESQALKHEQQESGSGQGWWVFFGVNLQQTRQEKKNRKAGKWLCFGVPFEAFVGHCKKMEFEHILLGGGRDEKGVKVETHAEWMVRSELTMSKGGIAPMDIWEGGEDYGHGLLQDMNKAMAAGCLRLRFLAPDAPKRVGPKQTSRLEELRMGGQDYAKSGTKRKKPAKGFTEEEAAKMKAANQDPSRVVGCNLASMVLRNLENPTSASLTE